MKIDCIGCAGCDYDDCRRMTEMLEQDEANLFERMNFLAWIKTATGEEIDVARKNNAAKLAELTTKYENDLRLIALTNGTDMEDFERKMVMLKSEG